MKKTIKVKNILSITDKQNLSYDELDRLIEEIIIIKEGLIDEKEKLWKT